MIQYDFLIAGVRLRLNSPEPLVMNPQTEAFRTAPAEPELTIDLDLVDVLPQPGGRTIDTGWETRLYLDGEAVWQETYDRKDGTALLRSRYVSGESRARIWARRDYMPHTVRSWVLWSAMDLPWLLLNRGILTLHSASVLTQSGVILFAAPSQTGKSTQARLWNQYRGAVQLNGDKNCVTLCDGRPEARGTPFSGTSQICQPYEAPLRAIVLLRQAPINRVTRLRGLPAILGVLENCFAHKAVPGCMDMVMTNLDRLLDRVSVYRLECTPDENAVSALERALED